MSNDVFDGQILTEKLSKLNNSQQSIESLSRWCITHRKKAKQIVETWDKLFNSSQKEQRVSFLYLANDILQNSRRKGSEFVNEFWKVLPAALKHVYENGDEYGKKAVTRLVAIWEDRKVFGSRGQNLKDELFGKNKNASPPPPPPPPPSVNNGKSSNPIKIVKRDAHAVRIKLAVGGLPEKILTAYQSVLEDNPNEDSALNNCNAAVQHLSKIGEEVESSLAQGNHNGSAFLDELQQQENSLQKCIEQLGNVETTRAALIFQLKEALQEQESKLEVIRNQLQVARGQIEQASNMRKRLSLPPGLQTATTISTAEAAMVMEHNLAQPTGTPPQPHAPQPGISFAPSMMSEEENKKAAAAAVAAKLAASTSSAQMLTSVLSSLVAEEAAAMNGSLKSGGFTMFPPEKRPKLEKPMPVPDASNSDMSSAAYFSPLKQQTMNNMPLAPLASMQPMSQGNQIPAPFASVPPPPPPPPLSSANPPASQYVQSTGMMVGGMPYGYGGNTLPPPPPLPPHIAMSLARPQSQPLQQPQSHPPQQPQSQPPQQPQSQPLQPPQQQQQQPATGGFYRPPGIGFYGQNPQSTPPLPRQ